MRTLIAALLLALTGCTTQVANTPPVAAAPPINRTCPISHEKLDPSVTVKYKGQQVGFCCSECVDDWARMADDLKDQRLKDSM
jgi:hypothetical protein